METHKVVRSKLRATTKSHFVPSNYFAAFEEGAWAVKKRKQSISDMSKKGGKKVH
jgi:hypothetical protein